MTLFINIQAGLLLLINKLIKLTQLFVSIHPFCKYSVKLGSDPARSECHHHFVYQILNGGIMKEIWLSSVFNPFASLSNWLNHLQCNLNSFIHNRPTVQYMRFTALNYRTVPLNFVFSVLPFCHFFSGQLELTYLGATHENFTPVSCANVLWLNNTFPVPVASE